MQATVAVTLPVIALLVVLSGVRTLAKGTQTAFAEDDDGGEGLDLEQLQELMDNVAENAVAQAAAAMQDVQTYVLFLKSKITACVT